MSEINELAAECEGLRELLTAYRDLLDQLWYHIPFTDVPAWDHKREKALNECLTAILGEKRTGRTMLDRDQIRERILPRLQAALSAAGGRG